MAREPGRFGVVHAHLVYGDLRIDATDMVGSSVRESRVDDVQSAKLDHKVRLGVAFKVSVSDFHIRSVLHGEGASGVALSSVVEQLHAILDVYVAL